MEDRVAGQAVAIPCAMEIGPPAVVILDGVRSGFWIGKNELEMNEFLGLPRAARVVAVKTCVSAAFHHWEPPTATRRRPTREGFHSAESEVGGVLACTTWRDFDSTLLGGNCPWVLEPSLWLEMLPAFLLVEESDERIGLDPCSIGLPPAGDPRLEVMPLDRFLSSLDRGQRESVAMFCELHHWLRQSQGEWSHFERYWHRERKPDASADAG